MIDPEQSTSSHKVVKENINVELRTEFLGDLLGLSATNNGTIKGSYSLGIPDYQRVYCWQEKNVIRLLDDINNYGDKVYHMGSIILHKKVKVDTKELVYDIVDGQQRLVTLSLLLLQLGKVDFGLLKETFESQKARNYIAHNKWIIDNYLKKQEPGSFELEKILTNLRFSVLILESNSLDIAYTFFNNENGKGKPLSDYDLLKSHHLRYIHVPEQAEHVVERWHNLIKTSNNEDTSKELGRTFELYLFRLRKWRRKREWNDNATRKVKNEFEAAPIIMNIPPFGEQLNFYESIQGGTHFFAYAEHFIHHFNSFKETDVYKFLNIHLNWEKHWWYRDVIEALCFAYFVKFGKLYLEMASILIIRRISQHRYSTSRAYLSTILKYASNSEIVLMIDQATSPTFFLAEMESVIKRLPLLIDNLQGTRARYKAAIDKIEGKLEVR